MDIFSAKYLGNTLLEWISAFTVSGLVAILVLTVKAILNRRLTRYKSDSAIYCVVHTLIKYTRAPILIVFALYVGAYMLSLPAKLDRLVTQIVIIVLLLQVALWCNQLIGLWIQRHLNRYRQDDPQGVTTMGLVGFVARLGLWSLFILLILDNLGFNITALVASMGIGGIAVALALQNILGDIFASLSIALDKPFVIGDFIIVDDVLGTIEYIGLKTTRIRSLTGEQIIISNADLLKSRIRNYKHMQERRVVLKFGVIYGTPADKLETIPDTAQEIIKQQDNVRFDRAHFKSFGDSSLDFEVIYYILDADYNHYMDIQQAINLELFRRLQKAGIEFAFPSRTLYVNNVKSSA